MIQELDFLASIARRKLKNIVIYTTNRCNSRCKTCGIWRANPKDDISLKIIDQIRKKLDKNVSVKLTGGEFLLHPDYEKILGKFNGFRRTLFSNGILAGRLIKAVKKFEIEEISISCDGIGGRYEEIRGVDNFGNIEKIVSELENETNIVINYTISHFNTKEDLKQVAKFCNGHRVKLIVGGYNQPEYFSTKHFVAKIYDLNGVKFKYGHLLCPQFFLKKYVELYNEWLKGGRSLPCFSIRSQVAIYPDGNVCLCEAKKTILGDLNKFNLSEIWALKSTVKIQDDNRKCSDCFMICSKPYDMILAPISRFIS